jgi:hypothetical protein
MSGITVLYLRFLMRIFQVGKSVLKGKWTISVSPETYNRY